MKKVNLSRIHHIIKDYNEEISRINDQLFCSTNTSYEFKIFEQTSENDYVTFKSKITERRAAFKNDLLKIQRMMDYIEYLKNILAGANQKKGIDSMLSHAAILNRKINLHKNFVQIIHVSHADSLQPIREVNFYKTTFTDTEKTYSLEVPIFNEEDLPEARKKLDEIINEANELNDSIASLNQKTELEIKTFEEFCAQEV